MPRLLAQQRAWQGEDRGGGQLGLGQWAPQLRGPPVRLSLLALSHPVTPGQGQHPGGGGEDPPTSADATLPAGVTAVPVSAVPGVGWARGAGSGTAGELGDVREVLRGGRRRQVSKGERTGAVSGSGWGGGGGDGGRGLPVPEAFTGHALWLHTSPLCPASPLSPAERL